MLSTDLSEPVARQAPDPAEPAITVDGLSLRRRRLTVLNGVNLHIPAGAVVGLVGRNGAGKSSLLRCLVGLSVPDEGVSRLLGAPSLDLPDAVRERLGYVAQTPDLFGWLNGEQHLRRFSALYPGYDERRALALAAQLALPLGQRASRLSGGDQQKLSVLLALAHDPDLLILDEPVASLDPIARRDFMRSLFERRPEQAAPRTVLISSHLLADLERVVTHVAFLREGRLQLMDEWDALAEHLRLAVLPADAPPTSGLAVLHQCVCAGERRILFDARQRSTPLLAGHALSLDELFEELNA